MPDPTGRRALKREPATVAPTERLTELVAVLAGAANEDEAIRAAVERAVEALGCEVGAFVSGGTVVVLHDLAGSPAVAPALVDVAMGRRELLEWTGGTAAATIAAAVGEPHDVPAALAGSLVLARPATRPFVPDEAALVHGMARILGITLAGIRSLEAERRRQQLLEHGAVIQDAIALRRPLEEVLGLITRAAGELLGDELVLLQLADPEHGGRLRTVASSGADAELLAELRGVTGNGPDGRAVDEGLLTVGDLSSLRTQAGQALLERGLQALAAPVHDESRAIGSLVVGSRRAGRVYSPAEHELLADLARHATIAFLNARAIDLLLRQALHDPLTSLANRTLFLDRLAHALARAERERLSVAVLFIDLDGFKGVNDTFGHTSGDALLVEVGRRLRGLTRATDTVARFGGDEFAVLIEDASGQAAAARVASAVLDSLRRGFVRDGERIPLSASVGIALAHGRGEDPLRDADLAMYRAKSGGKDRYEFFATEMRAAALERLELEDDLRRAIEHDGFVLHFQPIFDLLHGRVVGAEALIRWPHPRRGLLLPAAFVSPAEESGTIASIGRWALSEACRRAVSWTAPGSRAPFVSVNLSPLQAVSPELADDVGAALRESGLSADRLVLELSELVLLEDERTLATLTTVRELGVRLVLDDFGAGLGSLQGLQRAPLDAIKISRAIVGGLAGDDGLLAGAISELGRTLGLEVVAAGIEKPEQLRRLRALGCRYGQGSLLGRPADAASTAALLAGPPSLPPDVAFDSAAVAPG